MVFISVGTLVFNVLSGINKAICQIILLENDQEDQSISTDFSGQFQCKALT